MSHGRQKFGEQKNSTKAHLGVFCSSLGLCVPSFLPSSFVGGPLSFGLGGLLINVLLAPLLCFGAFTPAKAREVAALLRSAELDFEETAGEREEEEELGDKLWGRGHLGIQD